jgi:hypothetical protein
MFGREPQTRGEKEAMERQKKRTRRTEAAETSKQVILDAAEAVLTRFSQISLAFFVCFIRCMLNQFIRERRRENYDGKKDDNAYQTRYRDSTRDPIFAVQTA